MNEKKIFLMLSITSIFISLFLFSSCKKEYGSPPVLMDTLYNFNRTPIKDKINYKLRITNMLTFRYIDAPCGCIETKISSNSILENESCVLEIKNQMQAIVLELILQ